MRGVPTALTAVRLEREPFEPGPRIGVDVLVLHGDRVGQLVGFLLRRRLALLGAVLRQHRIDVIAVADGEQDLLAVDPRPVALGLRHLLHVHAHRVQRIAKRRLEVLVPGGVAVPRVGDG